jgi:glycosyltransferase involved in cell wall biosynthesis
VSPAAARSAVLLLARELNYGGSERQLSEMAKALDPARFDVHVGCFRSGGVRARELEARGIPVIVFPVRSFRSPGNIWASVGALRRYVRSHGIRVVHAFDPPTSMFAGAAARFLRPAVTLTSQRSSRKLRTPAVRLALRVAARLAHGVVVNCEFVRRELAAETGLPESRIHLCYNGIDADRFRRRAGRRDPALPEGLTIGTLSVFRPEKGLSTLVEAFADCCRRDPTLVLLLVGDGPERAALERLAGTLGVSSRCVFQQTATDVVPSLSQMDVFVLPSLSEALSNALMEGMAAECACVASRVGGNPELIRDGETGLLFEPGSRADLADKLQRLIDDPELRRRLNRTAADSIRERFTLVSAATRLGAIYASVMPADSP